MIADAAAHALDTYTPCARASSFRIRYGEGCWRLDPYQTIGKRGGVLELHWAGRREYRSHGHCA